MKYCLGLDWEGIFNCNGEAVNKLNKLEVEFEMSDSILFSCGYDFIFDTKEDRTLAKLTVFNNVECKEHEILNRE